MEWIKCSDKLPEENGRYIVTVSWLGRNYIEISDFSKDLYKVDKYDFYEYKGKNKKSGWYSYDSEMGYYENSRIVAWQPCPDPYKESE